MPQAYPDTILFQTAPYSSLAESVKVLTSTNPSDTLSGAGFFGAEATRSLTVALRQRPHSDELLSEENGSNFHAQEVLVRSCPSGFVAVPAGLRRRRSGPA